MSYAINYTRVDGVVCGFHIAGSKFGSCAPIAECYDDKHFTPEELQANSELILAALNAGS